MSGDQQPGGAPAPRASRSDLQTVLASRKIPDGAKLVWLQDWVLDPKGGGCWLTDAQLGERLGMSARTVERHRLDLAGEGLHIRVPPGRSHTRGWRAIVPARARVRSADVEPDTVIRKRVALDDGITAWELPRPRGTSPPAVRETRRTAAGETPQRSGEIPAPERELSSAFDFDSQSEATSFAVQAGQADEVSPDGPESKADERPSQAVEGDGWQEIRRRHAAVAARVTEEKEQRGIS
jgi:hypothetical protein